MMTPGNASAANPAMLLAFMAQQRLESDGNQEITAILPYDDTFGEKADSTMAGAQDTATLSAKKAALC